MKAFKCTIVLERNSLRKKTAIEKKKHYNEAVAKIHTQNNLTSVNRLYGSRSSLRKWDTE